MKLQLIVDNSEILPPRMQVPEGTAEIRTAAAWRSMQFLMRDHLEGVLTDADLLDLLYDYLDDEQLNADIAALEQ